ncbi:hypothetical protein DFH06DRAFT_1328230 [Mycena polygramma]|nr:hypothetical protein DFH06DRAFT_1328230 [Mycena polygramma]
MYPLKSSNVWDEHVVLAVVPVVVGLRTTGSHVGVVERTGSNSGGGRKEKNCTAIIWHRRRPSRCPEIASAAFQPSAAFARSNAALGRQSGNVPLFPIGRVSRVLYILAGSAPPTECSGLDYHLGAIETSYLDVCTFLEAHLVEFWDAMRATAIELAPSMPILSPLLSVGSDPVHLLLTRMRAMAEAEIRRPAKMADLRPLINLGGALSKLSSVNRERAFRAIDRAADGCLTAFLEEVWVREVVTDGWLPSPIPTLSDRLWLRLLRGDQSGATYDARMGKAMLAVAVGDAIGENLKEGVDVEDEKVFLATILSEQSLLTFMFRTGIYQDFPGCAFNGMDAAKAPHPARAFHLVLSAAYSEAPVLERTAVVASMVKTMWKTPMRVMCDGYVYFREHNTSYSTTEEPAQKRRRVASLVQTTDTANAEKILPQEKATHWALISTPENARAAVGGRTTIPKITTIGKRAAKTDRAPEPVPDALVKELAPAAPIPRTPERIPPMPITLATTKSPSHSLLHPPSLARQPHHGPYRHHGPYCRPYRAVYLFK